MGLLSKNAQDAVSTGGAYLTPSKIPSGTSTRFALLSEEPLEFYEVWGESNGKSQPFRFPAEPSDDDIAVALGDFSRRLNREGTGYEPIKFAIALPIYSIDRSRVEVLTLTQKGLIRDLDRISQMEEYEDITATAFDLGKTGSGLDTEYKLTPVPLKRGLDKDIAVAWQDAQREGFDLSQLLIGGNPFKPEQIA